MYGTDFPNIPYAWDREIKRILKKGLSEGFVECLLGKNAMEFFSIPSKPNNSGTSMPLSPLNYSPD